MVYLLHFRIVRYRRNKEIIYVRIEVVQVELGKA